MLFSADMVDFLLLFFWGVSFFIGALSGYFIGWKKGFKEGTNYYKSLIGLDEDEEQAASTEPTVI